jgi:CRP-like cAMP-binding protein
MQLSNLFQLERYEKNQTLFCEGDDGDKFYLILTGVVDIVVGKSPAYHKLASRGAGECFGEIALLEDTPRTATALVSESSLFLVLGRGQFEQFLQIVPSMKQELKKMAEQRMTTKIATLPLFKDLSEDNLALLASLFVFERFQPSTSVFNQGDEGDKFYLILKGRVKVIVDGQQLVERGEGECFGEVALLESTPRTATVVADSDLVLLTLTREQFEKFMNWVPSIRDSLKSIAQERTATIAEHRSKSTLGFKSGSSSGVSVDIFDKFLLLPGNMLSEAITKPGARIDVYTDNNAVQLVGNFTVKHSVLLHHYPSHSPSNGEPFTAVWWNEPRTFDKPFLTNQWLTLRS